MKKRALVLLLATLSTPALSQESPHIDRNEHLLDGISFTFQNQNASAADIAFADGEVTYNWTVGRQADNPDVIGYGTDNQRNLFLDGILESVER